MGEAGRGCVLTMGTVLKGLSAPLGHQGAMPGHAVGPEGVKPPSQMISIVELTRSHGGPGRGGRPLGAGLWVPASGCVPTREVPLHSPPTSRRAGSINIHVYLAYAGSRPRTPYQGKQENRKTSAQFYKNGVSV